MSQVPCLSLLLIAACCWWIFTAGRCALRPRALCIRFLTSDCPHTRCIKPNDGLVPGEWNEDLVTRQLRYSGLLELAQLRGSERLSLRRHLTGFVSHFARCVRNKKTLAALDVGAQAAMIMEASGVESSEYKIGKTKLFLSPAALSKCTLRHESLGDALKAKMKATVVLRARLHTWLVNHRRRVREAEEAEEAEEEALAQLLQDERRNATPGGTLERPRAESVFDPMLGPDLSPRGLGHESESSQERPTIPKLSMLPLRDTSHSSPNLEVTPRLDPGLNPDLSPREGYPRQEVAGSLGKPRADSSFDPMCGPDLSPRGLGREVAPSHQWQTSLSSPNPELTLREANSPQEKVRSLARACAASVHDSMRVPDPSPQPEQAGSPRSQDRDAEASPASAKISARALMTGGATQWVDLADLQGQANPLRGWGLRESTPPELTARMPNESEQKYAAAMVARLEDPDVIVRRAVIRALRSVSPDVLSVHVASLVRKLEDSDEQVRKAAVKMLGCMSIERLPKDVGNLAARLTENLAPGVRQVAVTAVGHFPGQLQTQHAGAVVARLQDGDVEVRRAAVKALIRMPEEVRSNHASSMAALVAHSDANVRRAAVKAAGRMPEELQSAHIGTLAARLEDEDTNVRREAVRWLARMEKEATGHQSDASYSVLEPQRSKQSQYVEEIIKRLHHMEPFVRQAAIAALGRMPKHTLSRCAGEVAVCLMDTHPGVRKVAVDVLGKLPKVIQHPHVALIVKLLEHDDKSTRKASIDVLSQMKTEVLLDHMDTIVSLLKHPKARVRRAAAQALKLMPMEMRSEYMGTVMAMGISRALRRRWRVSSAIGFIKQSLDRGSSGKRVSEATRISWRSRDIPEPATS